MQHLDVSTSLFTSLCLPVLAINDYGEKINMNVKDQMECTLKLGILTLHNHQVNRFL